MGSQDETPDRFVYSQAEDRTDCPSCGRYVGPLQVCPYCRAFHWKRPLTMAFKYLSPVLAVIGLVVLHQLGQAMGNPLVSIAELGRTSNFAYVQVKGYVCDVPRFYRATAAEDPHSGTLEFCLDDSTGRTRVKTYQDATRRLIRQGKVPAFGDRVTVTGNYQVRTHRHSLILGASEELEISRPPVSDPTPLPRLLSARPGEFADGERVRVLGQVQAVPGKQKDFAHRFLLTISQEDLKDRPKKGALTVNLPWSTLELAGETEAGDRSLPRFLEPGSWVSVTGALRQSTSPRFGWFSLYPAGLPEMEEVDRSRADRANGRTP